MQVDTSGTQLSFAGEVSTIGNSSTEQYLVVEPDIRMLFAEVVKLKNRISELENKAEVNDQHKDERLLRMKLIAEKIIRGKGIPAGKLIAATYEGDFVAEADTMTDLLDDIDEINQEHIFIWKAGSDHVDSW